jgi:hypothetical protein
VKYRVNKGGIAMIRRIRECLPQDLPTVSVNGLLEIPFCADSGAFMSCVTRSDVERLKALDNTVKTKHLRQPISCELAGGKELQITETVHLHLALRTAAGQVKIQSPIECLVVDGDGEFLLGQDVLTTLGIVIERQLELLASSDITDEDDTREEPTVSESSDDAEIRSAIDAMILRAVEAGFPRDRVEQLRQVVNLYDIWRVKLGNNTPAKVEPLSIRLKTGA